MKKAYAIASKVMNTKTVIVGYGNINNDNDQHVTIEKPIDLRNLWWDSGNKESKAIYRRTSRHFIPIENIDDIITNPDIKDFNIGDTVIFNGKPGTDSNTINIGKVLKVSSKTITVSLNGRPYRIRPIQSIIIKKNKIHNKDTQSAIKESKKQKKLKGEKMKKKENKVINFDKTWTGDCPICGEWMTNGYCHACGHDNRIEIPNKDTQKAIKDAKNKENLEEISFEDLKKEMKKCIDN